MPALRVMWIFASVAFSLALLASAKTLSSSVQSKYDGICQDSATQNDVKDPENWVWSDVQQLCVPNALNAQAPNLVQGVESAVEGSVPGVEDTLGLRSDESGQIAQASQACPEGSLSACLQDCAQYNLGSHENGETGAWIGCRASCSFRCSPPRGGCWKGWCWAGCSTGFPLVEGIEWCYTTKTYSQSYQYVKCSADSQCDLNWKCGGPCAAF